MRARVRALAGARRPRPRRGAPRRWRRWPHERHLLPHGRRRPGRSRPRHASARARASTTRPSPPPSGRGCCRSRPPAPSRRPSPGWSTRRRRWRCWAAAWPAGASRCATRAPRADGARRARAHRRRLPAHRPGRPRGGDRARLAAGHRHARLGLGRHRRGGPRRDRRRRRSIWWSATGTPSEVGALRDALAPRALVERTALPPETEIDDAREDLRAAAVHGLARPDRRLGRGPAALQLGAGARRGAAGPGAAPVGRVGGRGLARGRARRGPRAAATRTWRRSSSARWRARRRGWPRSSASSAPAGPRSRRSRGWPTSCARAATATSSPTSSTATSTTPTSATSAAASAASRAGPRASTCAATPTS